MQRQPAEKWASSGEKRNNKDVYNRTRRAWAVLDTFINIGYSLLTEALEHGLMGRESHPHTHMHSPAEMSEHLFTVRAVCFCRPLVEHSPARLYSSRECLIAAPRLLGKPRGTISCETHTPSIYSTFGKEACLCLKPRLIFRNGW